MLYREVDQEYAQGSPKTHSISFVGIQLELKDDGSFQRDENTCEISSKTFIPLGMQKLKILE